MSGANPGGEVGVPAAQRRGGIARKIATLVAGRMGGAPGMMSQADFHSRLSLPNKGLAAPAPGQPSAAPIQGALPQPGGTGAPSELIAAFLNPQGKYTGR